LPFRSSRFIALLLLIVFFLLSIYTWNWRTGFLDRIVGKSGLEIVAWIALPAHWARESLRSTWHSYVDLVDVRQENERLWELIGELNLQVAKLREESAEVSRLRSLYDFEPPSAWTIAGARVLAHRFGPHAIVESFLVDKGSFAGVRADTPVVTPSGVVGRVMRSAPHLAQVLLITDPNSRVAVLGRRDRTQGILVGQGPRNILEVHYVPLNDPLEEGEVLVTSGMDGVYPKGLPVARVKKIVRSNVSLFQVVHAEPLVDLRNLEEILLVLNIAKPDQE
jgi:rod shape-determining protein MreC